MKHSPSNLALAWCVLMSTSSHACAQGEWTLIGRDLQEQRVELTQLKDGLLTFIDASGGLAERSTRDLLAIIHEQPPTVRPPRELPWITRQMELFGQQPITSDEPIEVFLGTLTLTDGQRWVGTLASPDGNSLDWLVKDSIVLSARLDQILSLAIRGPIDNIAQTWPGLDDRVLLGNGDTLDGFVVGIGQQVRVETTSGEIQFSLDRVVGLLLANPPTTPSGMILRTSSGSIIKANAFEITVTGRLNAEVGNSPQVSILDLSTTELRSLLLAPDAFGSLAEIKPRTVESSSDQPRAHEPVSTADDALGINSLELHGPVRVAWSLPRPAARFATTATLPPASWAWGDCEIVVYAGDATEALRERLNADRPTVEINLPMGGLTNLTIEIASGQRGNVQDRVILTRPIVTWHSTAP